MALHKNLTGDDLHDPKPHTHVEAEITDLQAYLTEAAADLLYAPIGTGGANDPDALHLTVDAELSAISGKSAPADADLLLIEDSADGFSKKGVSFEDLADNFFGNRGLRLQNNTAIDAHTTVLGVTRNLAYISTGDDVMIGDIILPLVLHGLGDRPEYQDGDGHFHDLALLDDVVQWTGVFNNNHQLILSVGDGTIQEAASTAIEDLATYEFTNDASVVEITHIDLASGNPAEIDWTIYNDNPVWNAGSLQSNDVSAIHPSDGDVLTWDDHQQEWVPDAPAAGSTSIPHFDPGTGDFNVMGTPLTCGVSALGSDTAVVSAFDLIKSLHGGVASPTYAFTLTSVSAGAPVTGSGDPDPTAVYISYGQAHVGVDAVTIQVDDGTNTAKTQVTVTVNDTDGL